MKRQRYWFKVTFGKWTDGAFDPEDSCVFVEAWDAKQACNKGLAHFDVDEGEVITNVEYLGYPQVKVTRYEEQVDEKDE